MTLDLYAEPVAYDLMCHGLRLRWVGTDELSWADLLIFIRQSPRDSALYRAMNPDDHQWGLAELLIAEVADGVAVSNWLAGSGKRRDYPKPIPRPGVEPESTTYGKGAIPIDDMAEWLGWN